MMQTHAPGHPDLLEEITDLFTVKVALVLVPTRQALGIAGQHQLADSIARIVGGFAIELEAILSRYEIAPKG
jgi:hypothetical protein